MKKALSVCIGLAVFLMAVTALALPDSEVQKLVTSNPAFAKAEKIYLIYGKACLRNLKPTFAKIKLIG